MSSISDLSKSLGYKFTNVKLLELALCHRSVGKNSNERLEFLGDAILSFVIADELFSKYPYCREGELSRLRANLVRRETLASLAKNFDLGKYLQLGVGERKTGGEQRASILADAVEALIGAIYLDAGIEICRTIILKWYSKHLLNLDIKQQKDPKTLLQEYVQSRKLTLPKYEIIAIDGKTHNQVFYVRCIVTELDFITEGKGNSKQEAEQEAAQKFIEQSMQTDI